MARLSFLGRSAMRGLRWLYDVLNLVGVVLFGLAIVGLTVAGLTLLDLTAWVVVLVLALVVLVVFGEGAYRVWVETPTSGFQPDAHKEPIIKRTFRNERVLLDGFSYSNCTFVNVTFVFEGRKPFDLAHNSIKGSYNVDVRAGDGATTMLIALLENLKLLNPSTAMHRD